MTASMIATRHLHFVCGPGYTRLISSPQNLQSDKLDFKWQYAGIKTTVDRERFAKLNICGFIAIKVFMEILLRCLGHKCSLFSTIKERRLYSRKNFCGTAENWKMRKFSSANLSPFIFKIKDILKIIIQRVRTVNTGHFVIEAMHLQH